MPEGAVKQERAAFTDKALREEIFSVAHALFSVSIWAINAAEASRFNAASSAP